MQEREAYDGFKTHFCQASIDNKSDVPNIELESKQCIEYLFYK